MSELENWRTGLQAGCRRLGIVLARSQQEQLLLYLGLLDKWSRRFNLLSRRQYENWVNIHIVDSLTLLPHLSKAKGVLDVGSGAGLPGIPLAVVRPACRFVLLERSRKRANFLRQVKMSLALNNTEVVCCDAKDYAPSSEITTIVARAVLPLTRLLPLLRDFAVGGRELVLPVGAQYDERAVEKNGFDLLGFYPVSESGTRHHLLHLADRSAAQ